MTCRIVFRIRHEFRGKRRSHEVNRRNYPFRIASLTRGVIRIMNAKLLGILCAGALAGFTSAAAAQSAVTVTANNTTSSNVTLSSPSGCQGSSGLQNLGANDFTFSKIISPYATSNGCSIRYTRTDNSRYCNWVLSRTRSSLSGPWNYPTVNTTKSSSGVTCTATITSVSSGGDWSVSLTIAP